LIGNRPSWLEHQWGTWFAQASGSTVTTASTTYQSAAGLRLLSSHRWWSAFFMTDADNAAIPLMYDTRPAAAA